jgi:hypothetical protein
MITQGGDYDTRFSGSSQDGGAFIHGNIYAIYF